MIAQIGARIADSYRRRMLSGVAQKVREQRLTYMTPAKLRILERCLQRIDAAGVEGDCTEFGVALGGSLKDAYLAALACDTQSAFGGVLAFNRTLDGATARRVAASSGREPSGAGLAGVVPLTPRPSRPVPPSSVPIDMAQASWRVRGSRNT